MAENVQAVLQDVQLVIHKASAAAASTASIFIKITAYPAQLTAKVALMVRHVLHAQQES